MSPNSAASLSIEDNLRDVAAERFATSGWPGKSVEAFRFTPLDSLADKKLILGTSSGAQAARLIEGATHIQISGGVFDPALSDDMPSGIHLTSLHDDKQAQAALFADLPETHPVANLSFAQMSAGIKITISAEAPADAALVFDFADGSEHNSAFPVIMIDMAPQSRLRLVENHHSSHGLSVPLLQIRMADRSELHHVRLQDESSHSDFVALSQIQAGADTKLNSFTLSKGAKLARCETHLNMLGEQADMSLSHIYLGAGEQLLDITTRLNHAVPNCQSNQLIRGVLDDKARGVFQGMVRVAPNAQKTDGQQMSRALLLSRDAEADAKPELEIYADDVVCSHGATVGELDETHLFYLMSRGIPEAEARALLIEAFLIDGLEQIEDPALAAFLTKAVRAWAAKATSAQGAMDRDA